MPKIISETGKCWQNMVELEWEGGELNFMIYRA